MAYWLMKSEPDTFSIDDLYNLPGKRDSWDGIRNYQARNFMRDMQLGDEVFFYHSNTKIPGIVGIMTVCKTIYPDHTAFDKNSKYYDPKSTPEKPRWEMVDVKYKRKLQRIISLSELKATKSLQDMPLVKKGSRLSINPVDAKQWEVILKLEKIPQTIEWYLYSNHTSRKDILIGNQDANSYL